MEDTGKDQERVTLVPTITSIKPQKKRKRFNIYLDGKFTLALSAEALAKAGLRVDQEISEKEIKKFKEQDVKNKLYERVLKFLSYRPRSEKEIRDYLKRKGEEGKVGEEIIKKLKDQGLIDDRAFAEWWIGQRSRFRPKGRRMLWLELFKKGLQKEVIEESLISENEELGLAQKAAGKKIRGYKNLEPLEFRQKMAAFLGRRGFSWETIKKVLEEIQKKS